MKYLTYNGQITIAIQPSGEIIDQPIEGNEVVARWTENGYMPKDGELPEWFWNKFGLDDDGAIVRK